MAAGVSDVSDDESVDLAADLADAVELLREEDAIAAEEKRLVKEYPAGTCNAEDAWSDFMKREREFKKRRTAFLREPQVEVKHGES